MIDIERRFMNRFRRKSLFWLCRYIKNNYSVANMVEVGSMAGLSTSVFFEYFNVTSVDPYMHGYDDSDNWSGEDILLAAKNHFARAFKGKVNQINEPSHQAADQFKDKSLDFVYIDGDHTYDGVKTDISVWVKKIRPTGVIGGHDYKCPRFPGTTKAIHEAFDEKDIRNLPGFNWLVPISKIKI